ncbi:MAG TPA: Hsp20/alpha crystallin family protein [Spirochaetales bacterium]|nr:Hsp20/alpha crystallin family protein [Spirochaetales bacterium]MBP7263026.1 Hsp20/alpha crystallin family protein [Spirochaetia bacterium]HPE35974.1 Hsp20/alpha crystallin family protein [Spirochaetales bacterium]
MKSVVTYNPDSVLSIFDDWDRMLGDFLGRESYTGMASAGYPPVDVREEKERYVLEAELPGLGEKDVAIKVNDRVLSIASVKEEDKKEERDGVWLIRERGVRAFRRAFTLPRNVDAEKIGASFKDGLLTVSMPKRPEAQEKTIAISRG